MIHNDGVAGTRRGGRVEVIYTRGYESHQTFELSSVFFFSRSGILFRVAELERLVTRL